MGIFGWDLPPGCSINDIPGNRPEDVKWEAIIDNFFDAKRIKERKFGIQITNEDTKIMDEVYKIGKYSGAVDSYIQMAIEYGIELGRKQEQEYQTEAVMYVEAEQDFKDDQIRDILEYMPMWEG